MPGNQILLCFADPEACTGLLPFSASRIAPVTFFHGDLSTASVTLFAGEPATGYGALPLSYTALLEHGSLSNQTSELSSGRTRTCNLPINSRSNPCLRHRQNSKQQRWNQIPSQGTSDQSQKVRCSNCHYGTRDAGGIIPHLRTGLVALIYTTGETCFQHQLLLRSREVATSSRLRFGGILLSVYAGEQAAAGCAPFRTTLR